MTLRVDINTRVDPFGLHFSTSTGLNLRYLRQDNAWTILTPCCSALFVEDLEAARRTYGEVICADCGFIFPTHLRRWGGAYPEEAISVVLAMALDPLLATIVATSIDRHLSAIVDAMDWGQPHSNHYDENGLGKTFKAIERGHSLSGKAAWTF